MYAMYLQGQTLCLSQPRMPATHASSGLQCEAYQAVFEKGKKQKQLVDEENRVCIENQCCTSLLHAASLEAPTVPYALENYFGGLSPKGRGASFFFKPTDRIQKFFRTSFSIIKT